MAVRPDPSFGDTPSPRHLSASLLYVNVERAVPFRVSDAANATAPETRALAVRYCAVQQPRRSNCTCHDSYNIINIRICFALCSISSANSLVNDSVNPTMR